MFAGMPASCIAVATLLDPRGKREAETLPIEGAVNIPASELAARAHELPPAHAVTRVAAVGADAQMAADALETMGRSVAVVSDWRFVQAGQGGDVAGTPARLWRPGEWLEQTLPGIDPSGRALDLACGSGRNAVFAASCGWQVTAVDVLDDALERGRALARRYAGFIAPVDWRRVDLEGEQPSVARERTDEAMGGVGEPFDLILVFRYLHRPLMPALVSWVRPGGLVMYETFTALHRQRHGRPTRDAFVLQLGELPRLLPELEAVHFSEAWRGDGSHTARLLARRPS